MNDAPSACFETLALNLSRLPEDLSTSQANLSNSRVPGGVLKLYRSKLFETVFSFSLCTVVAKLRPSAVGYSYAVSRVPPAKLLL